MKILFLLFLSLLATVVRAQTNSTGVFQYNTGIGNPGTTKAVRFFSYLLPAAPRVIAYLYGQETINVNSWWPIAFVSNSQLSEK